MIEVLKQALEALEKGVDWQTSIEMDEAITAIKEVIREHAMYEVQRLGQEIEQEPVAWLVEFENGEQELHFEEQSVGETQTPLYTHPPQRTWVGLTFAEICECEDEYLYTFARKIEAKIKEKNGFAEE